MIFALSDQLFHDPPLSGLLYLCQTDVMLRSDAVGWGDHVGVYHQLPQGPAPHQDLRLLIG